jgi:hypothetical protein
MRNVVLILLSILSGAWSSDQTTFQQLVGSWTCCNGENAERYCVNVTYRGDKTFKGFTTYKGEIAFRYEGIWNVSNNRLVYTTESSTSDKFPVGVEGHATVIESAANYFILDTDSGPKHRYDRARQPEG